MSVIKRIFRKLIKVFLPVICIALLFIAGSGPFEAGYAQNLVKPEWVMPEHYPEGFHGWGRIGYIDSKEIVINDRSYKFSSFIEYNSHQMLNDSIYLFKVGEEAGFLLDYKGEIDSLWLIEME